MPRAGIRKSSGKGGAFFVVRVISPRSIFGRLGPRFFSPSHPINQHVEHSVTMAGKTRVGPPKIRNTPGNAWTKKIRVVCGTCNNGWMSRLETAAAPLLTPLIYRQLMHDF